jgi:adenylate cyclase
VTETTQPQIGDQPNPHTSGAAEVAGKVFISYASQDIAVAKEICAALEAADLPCWIAPRNVRAGESYAAAIVGAINSCRMLVLVLSKNAIASGHVLREVERASSKKRPVLSVRMDATELPPELEYFVSANHWLDATAGPLEQILPALVEAVRGGSAQPLPHPSAAAATATTAIRWRLGALALLVAMLGVGYLLANRFWGSHHALAAKPAAPSIAVLPFADLSAEGNQAYFSDGIAEEILNVLAHVDGMHVASRTSSFQFRKSDLGAPAIAQKLGVRNLLEGSVRKAGDTVRVTAQLIDATTDQHLWSQTFDRPLNTANLFAIQDEIARIIVDHLTATIAGTPAVTAPAARKADTDDVDAYDLYLRGRALFIARNTERLSEAARVLGRALDKDPKFARAWEMLAAVYAISPGWGVKDRTDYPKAALDAAATALRLDPRLSLAYAVRATVQANMVPDDASINWDEIMASATQSVAKDPREATSVGWRGIIFQRLGYLDRADADFRKCLELDPAYELCRRFLAVTEMFLSHVQDGLQLYQTGLENGHYNSVDMAFAPALARSNRLGALGILAQALPGQPELRHLLFRALTDPAFGDGDRKEAVRIIGADATIDDEVSQWALWLLKAYDQAAAVSLVEGPVTPWARDDPEWLKSPARNALIKRWRLPDYWRKYGFPPQCKPIGESDFECR